MPAPSTPDRGPNRPYPPHRPVSSAQARAADREAIEAFGIPSLVLMEHAGRGLAALAVASSSQVGSKVGSKVQSKTGPVAVICGPGNNGGDGYACARFLASWGVPCRVVRVGPVPTGADAALEHALAARDLAIGVADEERGLAVLREALRGASLVVDAVFGVGLSRALTPHYVAVIEEICRAQAFRLAADVPSGIDADSGAALPVAVRADVTAAMGFAKVGCVAPSPGAAYAGRVVEIDIGLPRSIHARSLA